METPKQKAWYFSPTEVNQAIYKEKDLGQFPRYKVYNKARPRFALFLSILSQKLKKKKKEVWEVEDGDTSAKSDAEHMVSQLLFMIT